MKKSAPGPKGYPVVGVVPFMVRQGAEYLLSVFRRYGDVAELRLLGPMRMFLISHPDDVEYVLRKNHRNFLVKRPSLHLEAMMGNGLTLSNGDLWAQQRRQASGEEQRHDLLSLLLEAHDEAASMSEQQLRDEVTSLLVAGYESTRRGEEPNR